LSMAKAINKRVIGVISAVLALALIGVVVNRYKSHTALREEGVARGANPPPVSPAESSRHSVAGHSKAQRSGSGLTPDLAKSKMEEFFANEPNLVERTKFTNGLIQQLCLNGFSEEAFELLDPNYGMVRSNGIAALFTHADLPKSELLRRIDEISIHEGDKEGAIRGYIGRLKLDELVGSISDPEFQAVLSKGEQLAPATFSFRVAAALQVILFTSKDQDAAGSPQFLKTSRELIEKGYLQSLDFVKMAAKNPSVDAFERWRQIQEVIPAGTLTNGNAAGNPGQSLIAEMVTSDGPRTLNSLLKTEDYRSVNSAISQWTHNDPSGATGWYESNAGQLTPDQNNAVSSAFASTALSSAEFDVARAWAEKVQDPQSKEDLLKKISEKEKKVLADRAEREKKAQEGASQ